MGEELIWRAAFAETCQRFGVKEEDAYDHYARTGFVSRIAMNLVFIGCRWKWRYIKWRQGVRSYD